MWNPCAEAPGVGDRVGGGVVGVGVRVGAGGTVGIGVGVGAEVGVAVGAGAPQAARINAVKATSNGHREVFRMGRIIGRLAS